MATIPYKQDRAPIGGYASIQWAREAPRKRFSGTVLLLGALVVSGIGMTDIVLYNRKRRAWRKEKLHSRLFLLPLIQAEEDRRVLMAMKRSEAEEALIMKDVPGWVVGESTFHTKKWVPPTSLQVKL